MQQIAKTRIKVKMHRFLCPEDIEIKTGDKVKVQHNDEIDYGEVVSLCPYHERIPLDGTILETSSNNYKQSREELIEKDREVFRFCLRKSEELNLNMALVKAEHVLDGSKIIIYFTADKRVDFRELVKSLNNFLQHKTRVELWQISSREKAVLIGGVGVCGRVVCCRSIGQIPDTVGIKTVKEQSLEINPIKITGICGKLMCCLTYEHAQYQEMQKEYPEIGSTITVGDKTGVVQSVNVISRKMKIQFDDGISREITLNEYLGIEPEISQDAEPKIMQKVHVVKPRTIKERVSKVFKSRSNRPEDRKIENTEKPQKEKIPLPPNKKTTQKQNSTDNENAPNKENTPKEKKPGFKKPWHKRRYPRKAKQTLSTDSDSKKAS
jgi:cell fate regulator YaaT (PSP1 superfamily)